MKKHEAMQANASAQGVVLLLIGCKCHGGIGSDADADHRGLKALR